MRLEHKYAALAAAVAVTLGYGAANAQVSERSDRAQEFAQSLAYDDYLKGQDLRASKLVGARVRNADGETLGEIEELVIPSDDQDDTLVIVSVGGFLDVGDKLVALPYEELRISTDGDTFYFDRTEDELKAAEAFTYDAQAETQARSERQAQRPTATARAVSDRSRTAPSAMTAAKASNVVLDVFDYRASDLIGATVLDDRGESVGKIDDIVVSTEDDKLHAVLAIGGFAGFGAKRITMPFDDLQITSAADDPQVRIAMTNEQLLEIVASRPEFRYERQVAQTPAATPRG